MVVVYLIYQSVFGLVSQCVPLAHLPKGIGDLKQNSMQENLLFSGTVLQGLSLEDNMPEDSSRGSSSLPSLRPRRG